MGLVVITSQYKSIPRHARFTLKKYSVFSFVSGIKINIQKYEMYDFIKDPLEQKNLVGTSKIFASLQQKLLEFEEKILKKKYNTKKTQSIIQDYR